MCVGGGDFVLKIHVEKGLDTLVNSKNMELFMNRFFFFERDAKRKAGVK